VLNDTDVFATFVSIIGLASSVIVSKMRFVINADGCDDLTSACFCNRRRCRNDNELSEALAIDAPDMPLVNLPGLNRMALSRKEGT
jgi:hypothetical protein